MASSPTALLDIIRFRFSKNGQEKQSDQLAIEEPLEIIIDFPSQDQSSQNQRQRLTLAITMRTPGNDMELAAGFLFSEGLIKHKNDIHSLSRDMESAHPDNTLIASITSALEINPDQLQRHFFTNSSCGVCGKTSMQALELLHQPALTPQYPKISPSVLQQLPDRLCTQQQQFSATGSVHSAALFSVDGQLLMLREDVGRHNAMDKLIGAVLLDNKLAILQNMLVLVSGRASFELVQKALMADIPILASIGAPTSLAHQLANRHGMTLVGFLKADGFNSYSAPERVN